MKKFLMIWSGELISSIGSGMTAFALSVYVYQITGSATYVSLITLLAYLPTVLLSPLGGVLADRYDRRFLMIIGDLFSVLGLAYVLWNIQTGSDSMLPICIGVSFNAVTVTLMLTQLFTSITDMYETANPPHFLQMHKGELVQSDIDEFNENNKGIEHWQTVSMITVNGNELTVSHGKEKQFSLSDSRLDISLVKQNDKYDVLLLFSLVKSLGKKLSVMPKT